jgi:hypothetical protein
VRRAKEELPMAVLSWESLSSRRTASRLAVLGLVPWRVGFAQRADVSAVPAQEGPGSHGGHGGSPAPAAWRPAGPRGGHRPPLGSRTRSALYTVGQLALMGLLYFGYSLGRHLVGGRETVALTHARAVWHLQEVLRLPSEVAIQRAALHSVDLIKLANIYYIGVHFPAMILFVGWVFLCHRAAWPRVRNVLIIVTAVGLAIEVAYPLAPPRFLAGSGVGLVDTGAVFGPSPYTHTGGVANQYAAMPSLHIGWAILEAWAVISITRGRWRWLAIAQPVLTTTVVVVTANHYWLDGVVGAALVLAAVLVTGQFEAFGGRRPPRSAAQPAVTAAGPGLAASVGTTVTATGPAGTERGPADPGLGSANPILGAAAMLGVRPADVQAAARMARSAAVRSTSATELGVEARLGGLDVPEPRPEQVDETGGIAGGGGVGGVGGVDAEAEGRPDAAADR